MGMIKNYLQKISDGADRIISGFLEGVPFLKGLIMRGEYRLKSFVCVMSVIIFILSFTITSIVSFTIYKALLMRNAEETSRGISSQILNSMFLLMEKGWTREELMRFVESLKESQGGYINIDLFRGRIVEDLYGKVEQPHIGKNVGEVFTTGRERILIETPLFAGIYPIRAEDRCMSCHPNAKKGDVLGVLRIVYDYSDIYTKAGKDFVFILLILFPCAALFSGLLGSMVSLRIKKASESFQSIIKNVTSIDDLTKIKMDEVDFGFKEYNQAIKEIDDFTKRIRSIAIDREVFEFELRILEKFVITSEVVRDWKEHVLELMQKMSRIIDIYTLFSIFINEERCELDIFWVEKPDEETKNTIEKMILEQIMRDERFCSCNIDIIHNVPHGSDGLLRIDTEIIRLQTKSLLLEKPLIGGIVGIGVHISVENSSIKLLVVDGILSTLLNVVGSVKAIYKYTRELEYYATRDPLTHIYNQRMFWELLGYEVGRAKRGGYKFSVLVIDLDNFKLINDTFGHAFGDKFIVAISREIKSVLREGDVFARYGGDEFVAILPEIEAEEAYNVAQRIKEKIEGFYMATEDDKMVRTTASIGFSVYPEHGITAKDLFTFADTMMYKAKASGRNIVLIPTEEDTFEIYEKTTELIGNVLLAVEERRLIPYFQPIIDIKSMKVKGLEVLARVGSDGVIHEANEFIELVEKMGVLFRFDLVVLEEAFKKIAEEDFEGDIFINFSPRYSMIKEYLPSILRLTERYGVEPSRCVFEITERETIKNINTLERFIHDLKVHGFKFAIDDFGTGFSSFHYLKRLPIDFIKIEGEFIMNMVKYEKDMVFVKTMVYLAKELNIKTIAEKVESREVIQALHIAGIDYAQGYFIGHPSPEIKREDHKIF